MKGQTYVLFTIVFTIIIAIFAILNIEPVKVTYFFWTVESPLILIILFSVLMGGMVTATVGAFKYINLQRENKSLRKKIYELERTWQENNLEDHPSEEKEKNS